MITKKEINDLFDKGMSEEEILKTISKTCKEVTKERESAKKKDEEIAAVKARLTSNLLDIYRVYGIEDVDPKDVKRNVDGFFKEIELVTKFF